MNDVSPDGSDELTTRDERISAGGYAAAVVASAGDVLEIIDLEGQQVGDFVGFTLNDPAEWLSASHTRAKLLRLNLAVGDLLQTNWRRPMLEVLHDDVGMHDFITQMCDDRRYSLDYGVEDHRSCRTNFTQVLAPWGIAEWSIPDPFNLFQNAPIYPDRTFGIEVPMSKPGDRIAFSVLIDGVFAVSACPQDLNPCNGFTPSSMLLRVSRPGVREIGVTISA